MRAAGEALGPAGNPLTPEEAPETPSEEESPVVPLYQLGSVGCCYSRLRQLLPGISREQLLGEAELLRRVIDHIAALQLALHGEPEQQQQQHQHQHQQQHQHQHQQQHQHQHQHQQQHQQQQH
ncbi:unnamed protein product [Lampetra fluviatilis]